MCLCPKQGLRLSQKKSLTDGEIGTAGVFRGEVERESGVQCVCVGAWGEGGCTVEDVRGETLQSCKNKLVQQLPPACLAAPPGPQSAFTCVEVGNQCLAHPFFSLPTGLSQLNRQRPSSLTKHILVTSSSKPLELSLCRH